MSATWLDGTTTERPANEFEFELNAKFYGAAGDGVTDDTTAIQAALAAVPAEGATVYFPSGVYLVPSGGLTCANPVRLLGAAGIYQDATAGSVIKTTASNATLLALSAPGSVLELVQFNHASSGTRSSGLIGVSMTNANFNRIDKCMFSGFSTNLKIDTGIYWTLTNSALRDFVLVGLDARCTGTPDAGDPTISGNTFDRTGSDATLGGTAVYVRSLGGLKFFQNKINGRSGTNGFDQGVHFEAQNGETSSYLMVQGNSIEGFKTAGINVNMASGTGTIANSVLFINNEINALTNSGSTGILVNGPGLNGGLVVAGNSVVNADVGIDVGNAKYVAIDANSLYNLASTGIRVRTLVKGVRLGASNSIDMQSGGKSVVFDSPDTVDSPCWETSIPFYSISDTSNHDLFEVGMPQFASCIVDIDLTGTNQGSGAFAHRVARVYTSNGTGADSNAPATLGTDYTSTGSLTKTFTVTSLGGPTRFGVTKAAGTSMDGHCRVRVHGHGFNYFKALVRDS